MQNLRLVLISTALIIMTAAPANAFFIFQWTKDTDPELREYGSVVLDAVGDLYRRVSVLERDGSSGQDVEFGDIAERLHSVRAGLDMFVARLDTNSDVDIGTLAAQDEAMYNELAFTFSDQSYVFHLVSEYDLKLELPATEHEVFQQASQVINIMSQKLEMTKLRGNGADVNDVKQFQVLNRDVSVLIELLSMHSILLSTTR